jgi:hypothetical protein
MNAESICTVYLELRIFFCKNYLLRILKLEGYMQTAFSLDDSEQKIHFVASKHIDDPAENVGFISRLGFNSPQ